MTDMADVLRAHWFTAIDYAYCLCGADLSPPDNLPGIHEALAAHQAAALSAAGFGPVADAKRGAWDEGKDAVWAFMSNQDPRRERPTNPYREGL